MTSYVYDGSFTGFLTAVFDVYERRSADALILKNNVQTDAFATTIEVHTDQTKAARVWNGLQKRLTANGIGNVFRSFLSELPGVENILLQYIRHAFEHESIEDDYSHPAVLQIAQIARKVGREKHRMEAFVRFQLLKDGIFFATVEPDFDVLPLISKHFKGRYADQNWLIYDLKRKYGIHYNTATEAVNEVTIEWATLQAKSIDATVFEPDEHFYQLLWQDYFKSTGIPERRNMQLHLRHIPHRYWRYLTEKK